MSNPLKDPAKNPLKSLYENFWVPVFGRILMQFANIIEGETPKNKDKQTYDLRDSK